MKTLIIKWLLSILLLFLSTGLVNGQGSIQLIEGKVSYITSENVYVKFASTANISANDTLWIQQNGNLESALLVHAKSSTTCIGIPLNNREIKIDQVVYHRFKPSTQVDESVYVTLVDSGGQKTTVSADTALTGSDEKLDVSGRVTLANYNNADFRYGTNNNRLFTAIALNLKNIGTPKISAKFYGNYTWTQPSSGLENSQSYSKMRIFNALARYDYMTNGSHLMLGRIYNNRLASMGASDGLQWEHHTKNWFLGALLGFRPDIREFSLNFEQIQYGAYIGNQVKVNRYHAVSTIGYVEQTRSSATDRRYLAFQHSSNIGRLNLFASSELELYNPIYNKLRLSSFYVSANYRVVKKLRLFVSYDTRKAIIYYQSDMSNIDPFGNQDIGRNGLRIRVSNAFWKYWFVSASANFRFQSDQNNPASNYSFNLVYRNLPENTGRISLSYNYNRTSVVNYHVPAIRYSIYFKGEKLSMQLFYRLMYMGYVFPDYLTRANHYYGLGFTYRITKGLDLKLYGELSNLTAGTYSRLNVSISQHF